MQFRYSRNLKMYADTFASMWVPVAPKVTPADLLAVVDTATSCNNSQVDNCRAEDRLSARSPWQVQLQSIRNQNEVIPRFWPLLLGCHYVDPSWIRVGMLFCTPLENVCRHSLFPPPPPPPPISILKGVTIHLNSAPAEECSSISSDLERFLGVAHFIYDSIMCIVFGILRFVPLSARENNDSLTGSFLNIPRILIMQQDKVVDVYVGETF